MNVIRQYTEAGLNFISATNVSYKVILCDFGASLYEMWFDNKLMTVQVQDAPIFRLEDIRFGKTMGRVSGRIANSLLYIDGKTYRLQSNNFCNCLHGGHNCIAQKQFKLLDLKNDDKQTTVVYQYISPDGEAGFPGNLTITITYVISAVEPEVKIIFNTVSDKLTPVSLTNHTYYSLGDKDISNISMRIVSDKYIETSKIDKLPQKELPITKCFDFNNYKNILTDINDPLINVGVKHGYDNYWFFKESDINLPKVQLENGHYHLDIFTDWEGTMIYTNNTPKLNVTCKNTNLKVRKGIAIEPQESQLKKHLIEPNKVNEHWMIIKFKKK